MALLVQKLLRKKVILSTKPRRGEGGGGLKALVDCLLKKKTFFGGFPKLVKCFGQIVRENFKKINKVERKNSINAGGGEPGRVPMPQTN